MECPQSKIFKYVNNLKMSTENQLQPCSNCGKDFPTDKIDLHEAYCCRNIRRCQQCDAMIDIKDMDEHITQQHAKKPCTMCNQEFQPAEISKHELVCPRRPMLCQYCENIYASEEFTRHEDMCGARTKPCSQCHRLISLKDFANHESRCNRRNEQRQRREQRNQVSQDPYVPRQRQQAQRADRERQNSTNNLRNPADRSNSIQNINPTKPHKIKPTNIIGPQAIKPSLDPIPISVRMAMKQKEARVPLKNKN